MHTPSFVIETITPAIAEAYLAKNIKNRNHKKLAITRFARDMASGNWQVTGEAIKFDINGNLIDGQNRLLAVIESGATIQTAVIRGLAPETQGIMDAGTPRSGADQLNLHGYTNGKDLQAICNTHASWHSKGLASANSELGGSQRLTNSEVTEYADSHPILADATKFATKFRPHLQLPVGALGVAWAEFVRIDADAADDFFQRIKDLRTSGAGDPVATLIRRVNDMRASKRRVGQGLALFLLFRTWNAYRSGDRLSKFQIGAEGSWATIPEPK
ncbi:aldo-keto reductase family protein [Arthrobacter woluwensis]|uniref:hypothetical protein n=1 Tax=Arthrobacter woluwensis TaxID=156980 RepID=UPI0011A340B5|nr:hypothetical protein [Arthrobacter woluwensis]